MAGRTSRDAPRPSSPGSGEKERRLPVRVAVVDTGPLYAAVDRDDQDHARCVAVLQRGGVRLVVPAMVVAEASYLVGTRLGSKVEARFLAALADVDVRAPEAADWSRIGELVRQYGDFPLGGVDASVIALAERLQTDLIVTLDRRHFGVVKDRTGRAFRLLP